MKVSKELQAKREKGEQAYKNAFILRGLNPNNYVSSIFDEEKGNFMTAQNLFNRPKRKVSNPVFDKIKEKLLKAEKTDLKQLRRKINGI